MLLFDRSHAGPKLTSAGSAILPRARLLIDNLEDFHLNAKSCADGIEANVSIVVNEFADMELVIRALQAMHERYPVSMLNYSSGLLVRISIIAFGRGATWCHS
ncbi:hypothetical protein P4S72_16065 [Vibrio sp. PP-XX7]